MAEMLQCFRKRANEAVLTRTRLYLLLSLCLCFPTYAAPGAPMPPLSQRAGPWTSGHVQGIAVDVRGGYIYYSFTNLLARYDFSGNLVGTLQGWNGHLGDLDFNPADGRIYGSLEYKKDNAFYIAVIDGNRIDRVGIDALSAGIIGTVHLPEVARDFAADALGQLPAGAGEAMPPHRYGTSGIDGVGFGPRFGTVEGPDYLTVGYGVFSDTGRTDNDHQVLLQYDVRDWARHIRPLDEARLHYSGPPVPHGKYFVRTGNTTYGIQNLAYDPALRRWFLGAYRGRKDAFPNYTLFAVDALDRPRPGSLAGVPGPGGEGQARGLLLPLAGDGLSDRASGTRGWHQKADVGFQPIGHGLYYLARDAVLDGKQAAELTLMRWTGNPGQPFAPAAQDAAGSSHSHTGN